MAQKVNDNQVWKVRGQELELSKRTCVVGVLNLTPDSFSDGGDYQSVDQAVRRAFEMTEHGADMIDVGGESTRPGARSLSAQEELKRVLPVLKELNAAGFSAPVSIDTNKPEVAQQALDLGVHVVNDISGMQDAEMRRLCAEHQCGVVVMHKQGTPATMQDAPSYDDVTAEVQGFFHEKCAELVAFGIDPSSICLDPGIGFGKEVEHNRDLLKAARAFVDEGFLLMYGVSRKSYLGAVTSIANPKERDWASLGLTAWLSMQGVKVHRVHAVKQTREALDMIAAINRA